MLPDDWKEQTRSASTRSSSAPSAGRTRCPTTSRSGARCIQFRREFDQYVNLRPVRLMPGVPGPLAGRKPGDIDFLVVRENTEGEYSSIGGRMFPGTEREFVVQETVMTRVGVDRVLQIRLRAGAPAREEAPHLGNQVERHLHHHAVLGRARRRGRARAIPTCRWDKYHIDILTAHFVLHPDWFDVVVASNLFGDILSDLGPACTGTIGIAPSGNINPDGKLPVAVRAGARIGARHRRPGHRQPCRPDLVGAMMLEHLGERDAGAAILAAIERTLVEPALRTRDLGGTLTRWRRGRPLPPVSESPAAELSLPRAAIAAAPSRIASIDAFRGFVMFLMLAEAMRLWTCSNAFPASRFWSIVAYNTTHVPWQGCSLHDLIQPAFSFLVGAALPFSIASRRAQGRGVRPDVRPRGLAQRRPDPARHLSALVGAAARPTGRSKTRSRRSVSATPFLFLLAFATVRVQLVVLGDPRRILGRVRAVSAAGPDFDYAQVGVPADWPHLYSGFLSHFNKNSNLSWAFDVWFLNLFPARRRSASTAAGGRR